MLNLQQRIHLLTLLQKYITGSDPLWLAAKARAAENNPWFIPPFIDNAIACIAGRFLEPAALHTWISAYAVPPQTSRPVHTGITMAGNIPLAGFHDFLCCFIWGHPQTIRLSSKDHVLLQHMVEKMISWNSLVAEYVAFAETLRGCKAYIATGSNNTARYFEYYFRNYPHIIRKNRTSVAILKGDETTRDLEKLADDVYLYFGLGCRNVTKLFVPAGYDFLPLLAAFKKYDWLTENHKYKHNYDFNLAVLLLNRQSYMTNGSVILCDNTAVFSPISQLHYAFYTDPAEVYKSLNPDEIQCITGTGKTALGTAQCPGLTDYADGIDTMLFFQQLTGEN
ncbi:MAG TPA: acyl-CoA reductase [Agriterribacter sp.]|nr:acyl-CoA reductase [Agriterribacter sp.]